MKKSCIFLALVIALATFGGCKKQEVKTPAQADTTSSETSTEAPVSSSKFPEPNVSIENLESPLGTAIFLGEDSAYAVHLLFKTDFEIKNFRFFKAQMEYNEETNRLSGSCEKEYGFLETLSEDDDVILIGETGEILPFLAVSFESLNGEKYFYAIEISGKDGHALLTPFDYSE